MDCLGSRIEKLVDEVNLIVTCKEVSPPPTLPIIDSRIYQQNLTRFPHIDQQKNRLHSSASETSVASILMSLSNVEKNIGNVTSNLSSPLRLEEGNASSRVEDDEPTYVPFVKLKNHVTPSPANVDTADLVLETMKSKSHCSAQELDGIRREKNRMHAKQTRLRKKKMTQEMEVVS